MLKKMLNEAKLRKTIQTHRRKKCSKSSEETIKKILIKDRKSVGKGKGEEEGGRRKERGRRERERPGLWAVSIVWLMRREEGRRENQKAKNFMRILIEEKLTKRICTFCHKQPVPWCICLKQTIFSTHVLSTTACIKNRIGSAGWIDQIAPRPVFFGLDLKFFR